MPAPSGRNLTITIGAGLTGSFSSSFTKAEQSITRLSVGIKKLDGTMTSLMAKSEKVALALKTVSAGVNMLSQATAKANSSASGSLSQNAALVRSNERLAASYKAAAIQRRGLTLSSQSRITPPPSSSPLRPATPLVPRTPTRAGVNYGSLGHGLVSLGQTSLIAGALGYEAGKGIVEAASEYQHQLALANASGMTQLEIAKATQAAWLTTGKVLTTTFSNNLEVAQELRGVFGNTEDAISHLAKVQEVQAVLGNLIGGEAAAGQSYSLARALEARRATIGKPGEFNTQADLMTKAIVAFKGKITATDFQSTFKFARSAAQGWNNDFTYKILPTLMQEMKSSGGFGSGASGNAGTMLSSAFRNVVIGRIPKQNLKYWEQVNLLDPNRVERNKKGVVNGIQPGGILGSSLFISNPFEWVQKYLVPALTKVGANTPQKMLQAINTLVSDRTAAHVLGLMATAPQQFLRDKSVIEKVKGASYDELIKTDPKMQFAALHSQWENLLIELGVQVLPTVITGTSNLISFLRDAQGWIRKVSDEHPLLIRNLELVGGGVSAFALALGVVVLPLGLVISAIYNIGKAAKAIGLIRGASTLVGPAAGVPGAAGSIPPVIAPAARIGGAGLTGTLARTGGLLATAYVARDQLDTMNRTYERALAKDELKNKNFDMFPDQQIEALKKARGGYQSEEKRGVLSRFMSGSFGSDLAGIGPESEITKLNKQIAEAEDRKRLMSMAPHEWQFQQGLVTGEAPGAGMKSGLTMKLDSSRLTDPTTLNPGGRYGFGLQPFAIAKDPLFDTKKETATDTALQAAIQKAGWKPSVTEKETNISFGGITVSVPPEATRDAISKIVGDAVADKIDGIKHLDPDSEDAADERSRLGDSQEE